jgi:predicted TIM-barrel fold metal-dependent hydrolase
MDDMIYSCDDHLDLRAVPVDLWQSRVPKSMGERAPRVVDRDGQATWVCNDRVVGASGKPLANLSAIGRAGLEDDGYAAWNDWAVEEFNAAAPDRLCVLPFLPSHSPEAAVAELERGAERGHRGALERHPGFTLVLAEADVGWLPYFLSRMDMERENLRDQIDYAPSIPPSELFRHQVIATFEEEKLADQFIPYLGADSCMWASDYPHTDSTFPESRRAIEEALGTLPVEDRRKITALNCKALYRFDDAV